MAKALAGLVVPVGLAVAVDLAVRLEVVFKVPMVVLEVLTVAVVAHLTAVMEAMVAGAQCVLSGPELQDNSHRQIPVTYDRPNCRA